MGGNSGSHASHEAPSGLRPPGFDPGRVETLTNGFRSLLPDVRLVMEEMGDGENCPGAAYIGAVTKLPEKRVLEIMRALRTLGLAEYGPLCDIDSEEGYAPRGSGYWLWPRGFDFLRAMDEADAIAMEARQGTALKGLDGEAATARAEGIAQTQSSTRS
jgi:hypothetical protein